MLKDLDVLILFVSAVSSSTASSLVILSHKTDHKLIYEGDSETGKSLSVYIRNIPLSH